MQHPDEGTIHAWLDDALPDDDRAEVERHVASCAECSAMVAEARGLIAGASRIVGALDAVPGGVIPQPAAAQAPIQSISLWRALRITPARAAIAASLLIVASAVVVKRHDTPDKMVPHAPVVAVAEPAIKAAPARHAEVSVPASAPAPAAEVAMTPDSARRDTASAATPLNAKMGQMASAATQDNARRPFSLTRVLGAANNFADAGSTAFVGCYEVKTDSVLRSEFIPTRFALQLAPRNGPSAQHVVRAVGSDGKVDSILAGSTWRATTPVLANVSFSSSSGPQRLSLTAATNGSLAAYVVTDAERRSVPITRSSCVPPP